MIIGITGRAGSGKDTFAENLRQSLVSELKYSPESIKVGRFSQKLKEVCSLITGLPLEAFETQLGKKKILLQYNMTVRDFLIKFGTDICRNCFDKDIWVKAFEAEYRKDSARTWLVPDVRFDNEAEMIRKNRGIIVSVQRPNGGQQIQHESEAGIHPNYVTATIINGSTILDLQDKAKDLINYLADAKMIWREDNERIRPT